MSYVNPETLLANAIDVAEAKINLPGLNKFVRAFMGGGILAIAAVFAITVSVQTASPIFGALLFPVGFCMLYLLGYDLLTGVFMLSPLAYFARRPNITISTILRQWVIVFFGNFAGAITVAFMTTIVFTFGYSSTPDSVGLSLMTIGENRTIGYKEHGLSGMGTIFVRGILCNWMVSLGVLFAMASTNVSGKIMGMWMPIALFFGMGFEHSIVNMYLFPTALLLGADFSFVDYLVWNEFPVVIGNLVGGVVFTSLPLFLAHRPISRQKQTSRLGSAPVEGRIVPSHERF